MIGAEIFQADIEKEVLAKAGITFETSYCNQMSVKGMTKRQRKHKHYGAGLGQLCPDVEEFFSVQSVNLTHMPSFIHL